MRLVRGGWSRKVTTNMCMQVEHISQHSQNLISMYKTYLKWSYFRGGFVMVVVREEQEYLDLIIS
jgi:hypothetical protein